MTGFTIQAPTAPAAQYKEVVNSGDTFEDIPLGYIQNTHVVTVNGFFLPLRALNVNRVWLVIAAHKAYFGTKRQFRSAIEKGSIDNLVDCVNCVIRF